jgi:hypothetical protein
MHNSILYRMVPILVEVIMDDVIFTLNVDSTITYILTFETRKKMTWVFILVEKYVYKQKRISVYTGFHLIHVLLHSTLSKEIKFPITNKNKLNIYRL